MKYIYFFIFIFCQIYVNGQSLRWRHYRISSEKLIVDTCDYRISYRAKFYLKEERNVAMYDHCILDIGAKMSSYYSFYADQMDSIMIQKRKSTVGVDPRTELNKKFGLNSNEMGVYSDCYKNYPTKGNLTISHGIAGVEYIHSEPFPAMNWEIIPDTDTTILGHSCNKALLTFRGRNYIAWFSTQIPINNGPWKFQGLPGLILKITDTNSFFDWEVTQIKEVSRRPIYVYAHSGVKRKNCTRTEYLKILRLLWEDPVSFSVSSGRKAPKIQKNGQYVSAKPGEITDAKVPEIELE